MNLDNNKTPETLRATAVAAAYLAGFGCKPVETEVQVEPGWVADVASFCYPTRTECLKARFIAKRFGEVEKAYRELVFRHEHILTVLVEVKTTRADFQKDLQRKFASMRPLPANVCYIAYPHGILDEIPSPWIGLELSKDCTKLLRVRRDPYTTISPQNVGDKLHLVAAVAIRRAHRTDYAASRDMMRNWRAGVTERKRSARTLSIVRTIHDWTHNRTHGQTCLSNLLGFYHGMKLNDSERETIDELFPPIGPSEGAECP